MVEPRSSSLSVSVSANTDGRASKEKAYLQIDGVVSPGIAAGATKDDVIIDIFTFCSVGPHTTFIFNH